MTCVPGRAAGSAVTTTSVQPDGSTPNCHHGRGRYALQVPAPEPATALVTSANARYWVAPAGVTALPAWLAATGWKSPPGPRNSIVSPAGSVLAGSGLAGSGRAGSGLAGSGLAGSWPRFSGSGHLVHDQYSPAQSTWPGSWTSAELGAHRQNGLPAVRTES